MTHALRPPNGYQRGPNSGRLVRVVYCGLCDEQRILPLLWRSGLYKLQRDGWHHAPAWGWVCPLHREA